MKKIGELPKTWEEFCSNNPIVDGEAYIDTKSRVEVYDYGYGYDGIYRDPDEDRLVLPSEEAAKAHLSYMQLHQLRDQWRQGWKPTDIKYNETVYHIEYLPKSGKHLVYVGDGFLSFPTYELAFRFMYTFIDLIEQAGDLI